ncbi:MAG: alpha/beta fold hydrolase [Spirochaetota bacterium]
MREMTVPEWVDRGEYPYDPNQFETPAGTMSYVDEGTGEPIVMVHGNPYWSFEFRGLIRRLSDTHRCVAPDHIGFGLSDKPADWDYLPQSHAQNLASLLDTLELENITFVVNDWGGPIALSYALNRPERVKRIVVTNTWCWSVADDWYYRLFSTLMGTPIGRRLIEKRNLFARGVVPAVFGDKTLLTREVHRHITAPLDTPEKRRGTWVFPREIVGSSAWLADLWSRCSALSGKVALIAWGMKDIGFREKELRRWSESFPGARVVRFTEVGHFVAEEAPTALAEEIRAVL